MPQTVVVLGARNLGGAITDHLLALGWNAAGVARSEETLDRVPTAGALALQVDASGPQTLARATAMPLPCPNKNSVDGQRADASAPARRARRPVCSARRSESRAPRTRHQRHVIVIVSSKRSPLASWQRSLETLARRLAHEFAGAALVRDGNRMIDLWVGDVKPASFLALDPAENAPLRRDTRLRGSQSRTHDLQQRPGQRTRPARHPRQHRLTPLHPKRRSRTTDRDDGGTIPTI